MNEDIVKYTVISIIKISNENKYYDLEEELLKFKNSIFFKELNVQENLIDKYKKIYLTKEVSIYG